MYTIIVLAMHKQPAKSVHRLLWNVRSYNATQTINESWS